MEIGSDPYAVFVAGRGPNSDLYAIHGDGGQPIAITFSNVAELGPALSPDGGALAFLRAATLRDSVPATVWVMNLLSGSERELVLPRQAGKPIEVGWELTGKSLVVRTDNDVYRVNAPPNPPEPRSVTAAERAQAESSLAVLLGDPVFARVVPCKASGDLCVTGKAGVAPLAAGARDATRWGDDSVAFFVGDELEIRPLARGRPRRLVWSDVPEMPREITYFEGRAR
jgi:hypothetical protein